MNRIELNISIISVVLNLIISILLGLLISVAPTIYFKIKMTPPSSLECLYIILTILLVTFIVYNTSHETSQEMMPAYMILVFILFPITMIYIHFIYIIAAFYSTLVYFITLRPYKVAIDNSMIILYSFSKNNKQVAIPFNEINELEISLAKIGYFITINTKNKKYYYTIAKNKISNKIIDKLCTESSLYARVVKEI